MKKYIVQIPVLLLSFILVLSAGLQSCKTSSEIVSTTEENYAYESSLLWKIEGNELAKPSYLFGTIHLIDAEHFFWPEGALSAFDASEKVIFEIDMDDMFDLSTQMGLMTKAFMSDNQKLSDFYTDEEYKIVKSHFDDMGLPMFLLERLKPMFLTVFASGDVDMGMGFGDDSGIKSYEMELYSLSQDSGKEVEGLESIEYQISVFDSIPYDAQAKMLLETIQSSDTGDDAFQALIQMYLDQDINAMVGAMDDEGGIGGYEDILLYTRNKNWIPVMGNKMSEGTIFFAVGAGHLSGKDGILYLLEKAGYILTPLSHAKSI